MVTVLHLFLQTIKAKRMNTGKDSERTRDLETERALRPYELRTRGKGSQKEGGRELRRVAHF